MSTQSGSTALLTPEEADTLPDATAFELDDGELKERNVASDSTLVSGNVFGELWLYARAHGGAAYPDGLGLRLWPGLSRFVRPDACYFAPGVLSPSELLAHGLITTPPTIVVEVTSPTDLIQESDRKTLAYLEAGVTAVWTVHPGTRRVLINRRDQPIQVYPATSTLKDLPELPGFECDVASLFPTAPPEQ